MRNILIVGGGYAGLWAALTAAHEVIESGEDIIVTLASRDNYLTHRPRLYEDNPIQMRVDIKPVLNAVDVDLFLGEAESVDPDSREVKFTTPEGNNETLGYDRLIVAAGSELKPLPIKGFPDNTWNIDNLEGALALDDHLNKLMANRQADSGKETIVVVGSGMSGVELVTEMRSRLAAHGRADVADQVRVILIERAEFVAPELGDEPRPVIEDALRQADVEVLLGVTVTHVDPDRIELSDGEVIDTSTTIFTTGITGSSLAKKLSVELDDMGRLPVDDRLQVQGLDHIYAAGDIASAYVDDEHLALMSCQHASRMGRAAGYNAAHELLGLEMRSYRQPDYVTCIDLGNAGAVLTSGWERSVQKTGAEAKETKRMIVEKLIYPPEPDRDAVLAAAKPEV